jgi:plastocyanin
MRRFIAILLVTPFLTNCSESVTPVAPSGAAFTLEESPLGEWESPLGVGDWEYPLGESPEEAPVQVLSAPESGAVMEFGNPDAGTHFSPPGVHDQSFHSRDRVNPGAVVIDAGQKVTFIVNPGHRVAIYKDGTRPEDINPGTGTFVLDPRNRMVIQSAPVPVLSFTFHHPGHYLVICAVRRHFVEANMWAWVHVR